MESQQQIHTEQGKAPDAAASSSFLEVISAFLLIISYHLVLSGDIPCDATKLESGAT
jgi:hypothetical protein